MTHQLTADDLKDMTAREIVQAQEAGRLDQLLGKPAHEVDAIERGRTGAVDRATLRHLARAARHDLILAAHAEGRIQYDTTTEETPS